MRKILLLLVALFLIVPLSMAASNNTSTGGGEDFESSYLDNLKKAITDPVGVLSTAWDKLTSYFGGILKRVPYIGCRLTQFPQKMQQANEAIDSGNGTANATADQEDPCADKKVNGSILGPGEDETPANRSTNTTD